MCMPAAPLVVSLVLVVWLLSVAMSISCKYLLNEQRKDAVECCHVETQLLYMQFR